jgi:spectinomycin phosphotransferase
VTIARHTWRRRGARQWRTVRAPLQRVAQDAIRDAVADGWGLGIAALRYLAVGNGAYHWVLDADDGRRWFVTCDDLDTKPWLGADRDTVFANLQSAYRTAMDVRRAGLAFVVAPVAARSGAPAERIAERHGVSVLEYVDGEPGEWGRPLGTRATGEVMTMLAELHRSTPSACDVAHRGLEVPGRTDLDEALDDLDHPWDGGPLSEPARRELAVRADDVVAGLRDLDRQAANDDADARLVLTHGEPHPGNLIRTSAGLALIDWDTVALARPERDLWMLAECDWGVVTAYRQLTGICLDPAALRAYRLLWALTDVAAFTAQLRRAHHPDADADKALAALRSIFDGREPAPYGSPGTG